MKLILGNRNYSSWSLRGWLAAKQSGLGFEELTVPLYGEGWDAKKAAMDEVQPSHGKVPVLWDGDIVVWDSLAILDYLADKVGRDRFWPKEDAPRGMARAMVAEMHCSYASLRSQCPMNMRRRIENWQPSDATKADVVRILQLWAEARARFGQGGPFLFGTFGAADIFYRAGRQPFHHLRHRCPRLRDRLHAGGVGAQLDGAMARLGRGGGMDDRAVRDAAGVTGIARLGLQPRPVSIGA